MYLIFDVSNFEMKRKLASFQTLNVVNYSALAFYLSVNGNLVTVLIVLVTVSSPGAGLMQFPIHFYPE